MSNAAQVAQTILTQGWDAARRQFDPTSRAPFPVVYTTNTGCRKQRGLARLARRIVKAAILSGADNLGPTHTASWCAKWPRTVASYGEAECVETLQRACEFLVGGAK